MAIELGTKVVKDTQSYNDYAIGISLPLQFDNNTFTQTFQTSEQVKSNIKNLLLTKKGERILQPEFGSGLQELLFEINDDQLADKIENTIVDTMAMWLPYITVNNIDIRQSNELKNSNTVEISISFRVGDTPNLESVTFNAQV